jgi:hypothetical protein
MPWSPVVSCEAFEADCSRSTDKIVVLAAASMKADRQLN